MKKNLIVILLILEGFVIYFLQVNIFSNVTIAGVSPNLFVIYVLCVGLFANSFLGISFGVILGLLLDLAYGRVIGISGILLCIIGFLGSYFDKNFSKDNKITIIFMVAGCTLLYEFGYYFINAFLLGYSPMIIAFVKKVLIEILYNVLLSIVFYPLIHKKGYFIDRTFKKTNILTRYF